MNRYYSVIKNEQSVLFADLVLILFWWINPDVVEIWLNSVGLPYSSSIVLGLIILVPLVLIVASGYYDVKLNIRQKDEREDRNELRISESGYNTLIFGVTLYLMFVPFSTSMFWLLGVLILSLGARLRKRYQVENE